MPGCPRVPTQEPPRVVLPSPPTPARPVSASPAWSPPPRPAGSMLLLPTLVHPKPLPADSTSPAPHPQRWSSLLNFNYQSLHQVSLHVKPFPIAPAPERQHRPLLSSSPLAGPSTSVSNTRCPLPKPFSPLLNRSALQVSAGSCRLQRFWDLQVSANHCPR
jgi:hypothetical protein